MICTTEIAMWDTQQGSNAMLPCPTSHRVFDELLVWCHVLDPQLFCNLLSNFALCDRNDRINDMLLHVLETTRCVCTRGGLQVNVREDLSQARYDPFFICHGATLF